MTESGPLHHRGPAGPGLFSPVLRRLAALASMSRAEAALVTSLKIETYGAGADLTQHERDVRTRLILSGWACRQHLLADGRRQILDFLLPGDGLGLATAPAPIDRRPTLALTRIEWLDADELRDQVMEEPTRWPGLALAFARSEALTQIRLMDHSVRLGRQSAYERMAHLLLELHERLSVVGLAEGGAFPLPLTQEILADALALSVVHVNRVLQRLRAERRVDVRAGRATLLRADLLTVSAEYRSPLEEAFSLDLGPGAPSQGPPPRGSLRPA
jgi:CRP-like cAMP-binding protein